VLGCVGVSVGVGGVEMLGCRGLGSCEDLWVWELWVVHVDGEVGGGGVAGWAV